MSAIKDDKCLSTKFTRLSKSATPLNKDKVAQLLEKEWKLFLKQTKESGLEYAYAQEHLPLGVPSSFQYWDPYPISIVSADGAWMRDVDNNRYLDLSMGFGAMLVGHLNPLVTTEVTKSLSTGTLFVTPSPSSSQATRSLCLRFGIDQARFANSGTEATMYAVRLAKTFTGRNEVLKIEGGYHGSSDSLMVSAKPSLDKAGDSFRPTPVISVGTNPGSVHIVPFNNLESL